MHDDMPKYLSLHILKVQHYNKTESDVSQVAYEICK